VEPACRIERLRRHALDKALAIDSPWDHWRWTLSSAEVWRSSEGQPMPVRRGLLVADRLDNMRLTILPDELLLGHPVFDAVPPCEEARLSAARHVLAALPPHPGGDTGHFTPDYERVLRLGVAGLRRYAADLKAAAPADRRDFYAACQIVLAALARFIERNAALAEEHAAQASDPDRRAELAEVAAICRRIASDPPHTFHEAIQLLHFVLVAVWFGEQHGLTTPGRLDRLLGPFYQADLAAGRITPGRCQELIDCLYVMFNEYCKPGLAVSVMVGGQDAHGRDCTNDLSYLCIQALLDVRLNYPTVGICWHPGTPQRLIDLGIEALAAGRGSPAFFNDELIASGLRDLGVSRQDSYLYQNSTCVEIAPIGTSNVWVASPYFNVPQALLDVMQSCAEGRGPEPATFDDFKARVKDRLAEVVAEAARIQSAVWQGREQWLGQPLLSCFTSDCLERGLDIDRGGARYNWVENSFVGTANLVDSLVAVRELVYARGRFTLAEFFSILRSNYQGCEPLRQEILHRLPKYGNDDDSADSLAVEMTRFYEQTCAQHLIAGRHPFVPGMFCWVKHVSFGQVTGATPDGRPAEFALADGAGPAQGRERCGPTAAAKSVTKWNHKPMLGGVVLNLKFSPSAFKRPEDRTKLGLLLTTYMRLGGFEAQVNVVSRHTLLRAQQHPEEHRDLLVRVAGYSDYFTHLSPPRQAEIIARTEYAEA